MNKFIAWVIVLKISAFLGLMNIFCKPYIWIAKGCQKLCLIAEKIIDEELL